MKKNNPNLLGIRLANLSISDAVKRSKKGGLILAPSGPGLAAIDQDSFYMAALVDADINLADSGLAISLMKLLGLGKPQRTSGLGYLQALLCEPIFKKKNSSYWVMANKVSMATNLNWLSSKGIIVPKNFCYLAPQYPKSGKVEDEKLLKKIKKLKPPFIFLCVGSGPQEKLGHWINKRLGYKAAVICIGAAIGFLSGDQVKIPLWADRLFLGWLIRCISNPRRFIPRYLKASRLVYLALRYRQQSPGIRPS